MIVEREHTVLADRVAGRVLHEGVGHQDEKAREPAPRRHADGGQEMLARPEPLFSPDEGTDERALQEEGEHAFHRQRLAHDAPANFVNPAQFVPNWNSIGMPVTTPTAKFRPKILAQKRAARLYCSSPVRNARHFQ